jgi:hypothetical protein
MIPDPEKVSRSADQHREVMENHLMESLHPSLPEFYTLYSCLWNHAERGDFGWHGMILK